MSTLRVCATIGLGLSLALGFGCSSSSSSKKDAAPGGGRDGNGGRADVPNYSPDTGQPCNVGGVIYQPGQSFTNDCVTYTCVSDTNFTSRGTPCSDAAPLDLPVNRDAPIANETGRADAGTPPDGPGNRDAQQGEAVVRRDTAPPVDVGGNKDTTEPEVGIPDDTAPPADDLVVLDDLVVPDDTTPVTPDVAVVADTATPLTCTSESNQKYYAGGGVCFPCASSLCICDVNGIIAQSASCSAVDAQ